MRCTGTSLLRTLFTWTGARLGWESSKKELSWLFWSGCNPRRGREEGAQMGWEQWGAGWQGGVWRGLPAGVGLNHSQVSLSSGGGRRGSWSGACSKSHTSCLGALMSCATSQGLVGSRYLSQSEPPFSKKGKRQLWWPHAVAGSPTHGSGTWLRSYRERWLWIEKSSAPWCIIHGSVPKVGKKSCWWQKLQLRALFHPNGFWDQRVSNRTDNDIKGLL